MNLTDEQFTRQLELSHKAIIQRAICITRSYENALDLAGETRLRAWKFRDHFVTNDVIDPDISNDGFLGWQTRMMQRIFFDQLRKAKEENSMIHVELDMVDDLKMSIEPNQLALLLHHEKLDQLDKGISTLSVLDREALSLSMQDMSYKEAASALRCPESTYKARLYRAHASLKELVLLPLTNADQQLGL